MQNLYANKQDFGNRSVSGFRGLFAAIPMKSKRGGTSQYPEVTWLFFLVTCRYLFIETAVSFSPLSRIKLLTGLQKQPSLGYLFSVFWISAGYNPDTRAVAARVLSDDS